MRSLTVSSGLYSTRAVSVAKLTVAVTPVMRLSFFSTRAAQVAQVIPPILSSTTVLRCMVSHQSSFGSAAGLCAERDRRGSTRRGISDGRRSVPDGQGVRGRVDLSVHLEVEEHPVRPGAGRGRPEFHRSTRES